MTELGIGLILIKLVATGLCLWLRSEPLQDNDDQDWWNAIR
jgi:hypothetical protein